jgi:hypothetical protein
MNFPHKDIIIGVTSLVNKTFNTNGVTFKPLLKEKDGYCSLIPSDKNLEIDLKGLLVPIRKQYKNIYVWIDSKIYDEREVPIINFFQKHF